MKELSDLKNEFYEVMYKYEKSFSEDGVMANLTAWQTAKADLISLLRHHPRLERGGAGHHLRLQSGPFYPARYGR